MPMTGLFAPASPEWLLQYVVSGVPVLGVEMA